MDDLSIYPARCRKNIRKLMAMLSADAEIAYGLMQMTATLMDLRTDDDKVVEMILDDCGINNIETGERA